MSGEIKVTTFNIRLDTDWDGDNRYFKRVDLVEGVIRREDPDILCCQEVKDGMRDSLREILPDYTLVGCCRGRDLTDEAVPVIFKRSQFELISLENRWLSHTPDLPGSTYGGDQSGCPRMFTSAILWHRATRSKLCVVNTHLDHVGKNARMLGSAQILGYLSSVGLPFILTGDFNAKPGDPEIRMITDAQVTSPFGRKTVDCTVDVGATFHDYGRRAPDQRTKIDYIFTDLEPVSASIAEDEHPGGRYYSDHFAVSATVRFDSDKR